MDADIILDQPDTLDRHGHVHLLAAQRVDPYLERPAQACVGAHLRRIRFGELSFRESGYLASEREIISVVGFLAALPCFQDAVFNFAGGATCRAEDQVSGCDHHRSVPL